MDSKFIETLKKKAADFKEERSKVMAEIQKSHDRLTNLNGAIAGIDQLLLIEGVNPATGEQLNSSMPLAEANEDKGLAELLPEVMADKAYRSLDELIELLNRRGFDFAGKHPKKAVGFTLLGLRRGGKYERNETTGKWKYLG